jgi:hypothetical protein
MKSNLNSPVLVNDKEHKDRLGSEKLAAAVFRNFDNSAAFIKAFLVITIWFVIEVLFNISDFK